MQHFTQWPILQQTLSLYAEQPMVGLLLSLMLMDIASGLLAAYSTGSLSSSVSWAGMCKKTSTLLMVGLSAAIDPFIADLPTLKLAAGFYCCSEGLSVIENVAICGVPIPEEFVKRLAKLSPDKWVSPPGLKVTQAAARNRRPDQPKEPQ
jgi:toxin secretion/phage lysis holin